MTIPDGVVEAAARAYRAKVEWIDRHSRDDYGREDEMGMRAALEAATPHLRGLLEEVWCRGALEMAMQAGDSMSDDLQAVYKRNPYRADATRDSWRHRCGQGDIDANI